MSDDLYGVIGAGIIGSWSALHLVRSGARVVLLEQFPMPHTRGSSHGGSRVIRMMGDDTLAPLEYSYDQWRDLEKLSREQLLVTTGLINLGLPGDEYLKKYTNIMKQGMPRHMHTHSNLDLHYAHSDVALFEMIEMIFH